MLSPSVAEECLLALVEPFGPADQEQVAIEAAAGRILAVAPRSSLDFPHWDQSSMDGFAVRWADVAAVEADRPAVLEIVAEIPAGYVPQRPIGPGQAARIFTGAIIPEGTEAIAIQEICTWTTGPGLAQVQVLARPEIGQFIRRRGEFARVGDRLLSVGQRLGPAEVALLAAAQSTEVTVFRRPIVAILSTGDELVTVGQPLKPGQIVDSNRYALAAFLQQVGAIVRPMGLVPDDRPALKTAMAEAIASADLVLSTGGVSVGDYDYVEALLGELGGEIAIRSVAIRPGKPLTVAAFPASPNRDDGKPARPCLYFGLPGNPASALVTCWRFVAPVLAKRSGVAGPWSPVWLPAIAQATLKGAGPREAYLWGRVIWRSGQYEFTPAAGGHNSGNLVNLAGSTALAVIPAQGSIDLGQPVMVLAAGPNAGPGYG